MADLKAETRAPVVRARPLSPHLTIWRWHITMAASILHRATGVALYGGAFILAYWCLSLAGGAESYASAMGILGSPIGKLILFALTVSVFYHMANGLRHLVWDQGRGFEPRTADFTAVVSMAFGLAAAVAVWALALLTGAA